MPDNLALPSANDVLDYWRDLGPDRWFVHDPALDADVRARFAALYQAAAAKRLGDWENHASGTLARVIVLDQFPRNMFRGTAAAFAADPVARTVAARAIARGFDRHFSNPERRFFYLPFMHSEDSADQQRCAQLCRDANDAGGLEYATHHADIIHRFGRFPHRNAALGRVSTPAERVFLEQGGFAG